MKQERAEEYLEYARFDCPQFHAGKNGVYSIEYFDGKYTILEVTGEHRNILIRGSKPLAIKKLMEIY